MDYLPAELLEKILGYLNPYDRLVASEVCVAWYEASLSPTLWKDISLVIESSIDRAIYAVGSTKKPIQHVIIKDVNFTSCDPRIFKFWENISQRIISIEVNQSFMTEANLLNLIIPCTNLETLHFHNCRDTFITGKLLCNPLVLQQVKIAVPNLKEICFLDNGSYLSDALVDRFMSIITNLESLGFSGTSVSFHPGIHKRFYSKNSNNEQTTKSSELVLTFDCILDQIRNSSKGVKHLDFSKTLINDKSCLFLSQVENLQLRSLLLRSCEVGHPGIRAICTTQPSIIELDLSFSARVTDTALNSISTNLRNLRKLSIQSCRAVTDVGISSLCQLHNLSEIDLQGLERITSEGVEKGLLANVNTKLRRLNLAATRITEDTLYKLAKNAPELAYLNITSCVKALSDLSLRAILISLHRLCYLMIDWCSGITDLGFMCVVNRQGDNAFNCESQVSYDSRTIARSKVNLVHLSLVGCNKLTDLCFSQALRFTDIRYLDLNACSLISDEGLVNLGSNNPGIETLNLNYCSKLTDSGLKTAIEKMPRLRKLELHGCLKLTTRILKEIEKLRYLNHLDISYCKLISFESALEFHSRMPSIKVFHTSGLE